MSITTVFLIAACNMCSLRASKVLVTLYALHLGAGEAVVGILVAAYGISPMLLALFAGRLTDRIGVRVPMLIGSAGCMAGLLVPAIVPSVPALFVSSLIIGTSYVFYHVAVQQLIGLLSTAETRTRNFSHYSLVQAVASLLGPLVAGIGIDLFGHRWMYIGFAVLPLLATAGLLATPGLRGMRAKGAGEGARRVGDLLRNPAIRRVLFVSGIALAGNDLFLFYLPVYASKAGLSATQIGLVLAAFAAAAFVVRTAIPLLARRLGEGPLLTVCLVIAGFTYLLFPLFVNPWALGAAAFALGLAMGVCQPVSILLAYACAPAGRTGETLGMRLFVMYFTQTSVPLSFGAVGAMLGAGPVFWAVAALLVGGGWMNRGLMPAKPPAG
ncbi:MAG: MFS transporter [Burkholderiales bacterium]